MIIAENINKKFDDANLFSNLNLTINTQDFVSIIGESGKGKTTLLNLLSFLDVPDSGFVTIDEMKYEKKALKKLRRNHFSYLFQNYGLMDDETVEKNLLVALLYKKKINKTKEIKKVLDEVGLVGFEKKKIYQLSGGEQQRIALARLILKDAPYIFADEPTGNLDEKNSSIVHEILKKLNKKGKTVVVVTHDKIFLETSSIIIDLDKI